MNLFDFAHSLLTGSFRLDREVVREQRAYREATRPQRDAMVANHTRRMQLYAGAQRTINRPPPNQLSTPEDYRQAWERIVLIRAAHDLEEDGGFFDGILDDFETYVVGEQAIWVPNTGNPDANKRIREYTEWKFDQADYSQRLDLTKMSQVAVRTMKRDGECGFVPVDVGDSIKLRYYSGDCIGNPMIATAIGPNNFNGIRTDPASDAPIYYDLFKRVQKMNVYLPDRTVRADQFWHYYDPFRFQQYHGVSAFKTAIRDGFDIDQLLEFTKMNMKFRASQLPTVHTETGRPKGAQNGYFGWGSGGVGGPATSELSPSPGPQPMTVNVDGVTSTYLNLEEKVMEYPNDFPNGQLQVSIEEFRRQCCKGAKLPYEFVYRADNGGVVQRFWVDKAMRTFGKDKFRLKRIVLNPYKNRTIQKGIDTGELDLDPFGTLNQDVARFRGQWQLGSQTSVDYHRETMADISQIEAGLMSPVDFATDNRRDLDEIREEIRANVLAVFKDALQISKETGRPFEEVLPFMLKKYPNPPAGTGGVPAAAGAADPNAPVVDPNAQVV